jgi:hypothetical protein
MTDVPAFVRNNRRDLLAANRLGFAVYSEVYADQMLPGAHLLPRLAGRRHRHGRQPPQRSR